MRFEIFKENHNKLKWLVNVNTTHGIPLTIIGREGQSSHFDQFVGVNYCFFPLRILSATVTPVLSFAYLPPPSSISSSYFFYFLPSSLISLSR